jgi:mono/diheme cytochrome c family protein
MLKVLAGLTLGLVLTGCEPALEKQPRFSHQAKILLPPEGSIPRVTFTSVKPPMNRTSLLRGRERYEIFCSVCHGSTGRGVGMAIKRGFPPPADFTSMSASRLSSAHIYAVITDGLGTMAAFSGRISKSDRWQIAYYVEALRLRRHFPSSALTDSDRARLQGEGP